MIHQAFCVIWKQLRNLGLESRCGKQQVEVWSIKNRCETSRLGDEQMPGYSLSCFRSPPVLREASMAPGLLNPDVCIGWALEISRSFHRGDWPGDDGSEVFIWSWYAGRQTELEWHCQLRDENSLQRPVGQGIFYFVFNRKCRVRLTNCVYVYTLLIAIGCHRNRKWSFLEKHRSAFVF